MKRIYVDESGNTGAIKEKVKEEYKFNFYEQPYFALGGIMIDESQEEEIEKLLRNLYNKNKIVGELKYTNYKNRERLLYSIIEVFSNYNCRMFFDITNKRYKIVNYIIDYCVVPYYAGNRNEDFFLTQCILNIASDILYDELGDDILYKFIETTNGENNSIDKLIEFCTLLEASVHSRFIKEQIKETIDSIKRHKGFRLSKENLFPLIDSTNIGKKPFSLLPNIDAISNLVFQLTKNETDNIEVFHDNQKEYSKSLSKWVNEVAQNKKINITTRFEESKENVILQAVDFITGHVNENFINKNIYNNEYMKDIVKNKVNFVSTYSQQKIMRKFSYMDDILYNMLYTGINEEY